MGVNDGGYLRYPTISGDTIVFVCEDDLWSVPAGGGRAWRLTAGVAAATRPCLSPDGSQLAFVGQDEGPGEIYVMPAEGGSARRLTYDGAGCVVRAWTGPDEIVFASNVGRPFTRDWRLHRIGTDGGLPVQFDHGHADAISYGTNGAVVLGRHTGDPARWKRYRGGTAGELWVDADGSGEFRQLGADLAGNLASPVFAGERIFFLSDHEGIGNVYSCVPDGSDLRRHTDHDDYYARALAGDGSRLVYQCAGDLYLLDPADEQPQRIQVETGSSRTHRNRQFVSAAEYLDSATLGPEGSDLAITTRGKAFSLAHWEGPVRQHGEPDGVRYRHLTYLIDHKRLVAAAGDDGPQERLVVLTADGSAPPEWLDLDTGRVRELVPGPHIDLLAITNHRCELLLADLTGDEPQLKRLDSSTQGPIHEPAWSPDGRYLAYSKPIGPTRRAIMVCEIESGDLHQVTEPVLSDSSPAFDPEGKYLYFLGQRDFSPVMDSLQFGFGFPLGSRPYLLTLRKDLLSPFVPEPRPVVSEAAAKQKKAEEELKEEEEAKKPEAEKDKPEPVEIDFDGITDRVLRFPVPEGRYLQIAGVKGKALFSNVPLHVDNGDDEDDSHGGHAVLESYDFESQKKERLVDKLSSFELDRGCYTLLYTSGNRLRVLKAGDKPSEDGDEASRATGWIDLSRVKVSVRPGAEWRQMFREAWRLQRDHFWVEDMSGIDWDEVYKRYLPLVDRVATRSELSDLLWELQGELGTSHAYEYGGAYRPSPYYQQGSLGIDWAYDPETETYRIAHIVRGDVWNAEATSPLRRPGVDVRVGDVVLAINGRTLSRDQLPGDPLVNQADQEVQLTIRRDGEEPRTVTVRAIGDERDARYRDWVEGNRAYVKEKTSGQVGYLHIPDMGFGGYAEFHRGFLTEFDHDALIVDVRFNGGGNVSQLLLEKLARRRVGYDFTRWNEPEPYPLYSPRGPLVALTNAEAGSDGDIFCHVFKVWQLGPLIGKRTWGGVIGYSPRARLADGTVTTQPEFSFAFDDVGWKVENYGTDPDIEVDITPQDYAAGRDTQLDKAIEVALQRLEDNPPHRPNPADRPVLTAPSLPPRPQLS
ncbi:S41 family peptidase [Flindersiella endophytica]